MKVLLLHLLLAGLALGQARVVAFGGEVNSVEPKAILSAIVEGYAKKHGLVPTEEELAPLRKLMGPPVRGLDFGY